MFYRHKDSRLRLSSISADYIKHGLSVYKHYLQRTRMAVSATLNLARVYSRQN